MKQLRFLVPSVVMSAALTLGPVAMAASAHNVQTGAHTSNANDSAEDAAAKQEKQEKQGSAREPWNALRERSSGRPLESARAACGSSVASQWA